MMRGDSLRDFYAKALALFGLALLGALGAAVDYWPANVSIPQTGKPNLDVATLQPLSYAGIPAPRAAASRPAARPRPLPVVTEVTAAEVPAIVETMAANVPVSVIEAPPPAADLQLAPPSSFTGLAAATDAAIDLTAIETPVETFTIAAVAPPPSAQKGLVASIMSSISTGGSKAGSAVVNLGGAVGGAFKSMWPFAKRDNRQRQMLGGGAGASFKSSPPAYK